MWVVTVGFAVMRRTLAVSVLFVGAMLLPACGSNSPKASVSDTAFESTTTAAPKADTAQTVKDWVTAISAFVPEAIQPGVAVSAPGSPAEMYASYLLAQAQANRAGGAGQPPTSTITTQDNGDIKFCYTIQGKESCYIASNFQLDANGKMVDANINDAPLSGRIVGPGQPVDMPGGTVQRLYAFETSDGNNLNVLVQFAAGDTSIKTPYQASYVGPDSVQIEYDPQNSGVPPGDVLAGAKKTAIYSFPKGKMPGRVVFQNVCNASYTNCVDVTVPVGP